jgi:hypothetical protein
MDTTGNGKSNIGVADRTNRMATGNNTAIAITATMALRTTHCSSSSETMAAVGRVLNRKKLDCYSIENRGGLCPR